MNYYQIKYEALETFYGWVDQGSEYNIAVEQSNYYNYPMEEFEEIVFNITIATRFERCGKPISKIFRKRLENLIAKYKVLNLEKYGLSYEELEVLNEDVLAIKALIAYDGD